MGMKTSFTKWLIVCVLLPSTVFAVFENGEIIELMQAITARSDAQNFLKTFRSNIVTAIPPKTLVEITGKQQLQSGNWGVKVEVKNGPLAGKKNLWVYYNIKEKPPGMKLYAGKAEPNNEVKKISSATVAVTTRALEAIDTAKLVKQMPLAPHFIPAKVKPAHPPISTQDCIAEEPNTGKNIEEQLSHFSDVVAYVRKPNYACTSNDRVLLQEAKEAYKKLFPARPQLTTAKFADTNYSHITFCSASDEASHMKGFFGKHADETWLKTIAEKCVIPQKHCVDTVCSLEKAFDSEEAALRALVIAKRNGVHFNLDKTKVGKVRDSIGALYTPADWTTSDIRTIDQALEKLPPNMQKVKSLKTLTKLPREFNAEGFSKISEKAGDVSGVAEYEKGALYLGPHAFQDFTVLRATLTHEYAHFYDFQNLVTTEDAFCRNHGFAELSGWKNTAAEGEEEKWVHAPNAKFVGTSEFKTTRTYAEETIYEDFAESFHAYINMPRVLKRDAPEKYRYMKEKVFEGYEYAEPCNPFLN